MTGTSRRRVRKKVPVDTVAIRQIDRKQLRNRFAPIEALDQEQLEFIHDISLRILEEEGVEVIGDQALTMFKRSGASVDANGMVRIDRGLLLETIAQAPE